MSWTDIFIKPEDVSNNDTSSTNEQTKTSTKVSKCIIQDNTSQIKSNTNPSIQSVNIPINSVASNNTNTNLTSDVNEELIKNLWNVLINKNLPGPDYLEVRSNAAALESMGLPEDKRYEAAFKMLKNTYPNFDKNILLSSIDTYISYINEELEEGKKQCNNKRAANIGDRKTRILQLKEHSDDIKKQIAQLNEEYEKTLSSISAIESEIATATKEIDSEEQVFNNSINNVIEILQYDKKVMSGLNI